MNAPVFPAPTDVKSIVFYAAHRDRFDDPEQPRIVGHWEKLFEARLDADGGVRTQVPADPLTPTVIAGLDADGRILKWKSAIRDRDGHAATFYAYAGDHYSGMRPKGYTFCIGCHAGHTFFPADITEKTR